MNNAKQNTMNTNTTQEIKAWGVYYVPNRQGKMFANLKSDLIYACHKQEDALSLCEYENKGGYIDELHLGYRVYPMNWIPKGVTIK